MLSMLKTRHRDHYPVSKDPSNYGLTKNDSL